MNEQDKLHFLEAMTTFIADLDRGYSVDGPQTLTIQRSDGTYRNKAIGTDLEFLIARVRLSNNGDPILCFAPEDPQSDFEFVEVQLKKVDDVFPVVSDGIMAFAVERFGRDVAISLGDLGAEGLVKSLIDLEEASLDDRKQREMEELAHLPNQGIF